LPPHRLGEFIRRVAAALVREVERHGRLDQITAELLVTEIADAMDTMHESQRLH
jgi:hypothetical protein